MALRKRNILAVGAHADDVEIGCGGTVAAHVQKGDQVILLVMTESSYTYYDGTVLRTVEEGDAEEKYASDILGTKLILLRCWKSSLLNCASSYITNISDCFILSKNPR